MTYITGYIRFFVMVALCLNSGVLLSSDRSFDPYLSSKSSDVSTKLSNLGKDISVVKNGGSVALLAFLDKSTTKIHDAYDFTSKVIVENPKQASAAAVAATVLAIVWYKRESIKGLCKTEKIEWFKEKINAFGNSAVEIIDNQIKKLPLIVQPLPSVLKGVIAWFYRKLIAMEGEYALGVFMSPIIGYINSWTPFGAFGGVKMGWVAAGGFLIRGWMGIDAAEIQRGIKSVSDKVDGVDKKVDGLEDIVKEGQRKDAKNHEEVLENIKDVNAKINQLSLEIKQEIEGSSKKLVEKVENSAVQAEKSREVLKEKIEAVQTGLLQLAEQVKQLPSKEDNQKIVGAMAKTIESFQECIASKVDGLEKRTEENLEIIKQQFTKAFARIDQQQMEAAENHKAVLKNIENVNVNIDQLSIGITQKIKESNEKLGEKIENSANKAEASCEALKQNIEEVNKGLLGLVDQVSKLPSKDENQKIVDEAMAKTIKKFENCIASNVEILDKQTEKKLAIITQQLIDGFSKINSQQEGQAQRIQNLVDQVSSVIDEREKNINDLTCLVDSTKLSNKALSEKFDSMKGCFKSTQEAFKKSDEKYSELLEEKAKDRNRLEGMINDQIKGFETINTKLSQMNSKIDTIDKKIGDVDQKTDNQYGALTSQIEEESRKQGEASKICMQQMQEACNKVILSLKEELSKTQEKAAKEREEAAKERKLLFEKLNGLEETQKEFRNDLRTNAVDFKKTQNKILFAVNGNNKFKKITHDSDQNPVRKQKNKDPQTIIYDSAQYVYFEPKSKDFKANLEKQFLQKGEINWNNHINQNNNGETKLLKTQDDTY